MRSIYKMPLTAAVAALFSGCEDGEAGSSSPVNLLGDGTPTVLTPVPGSNADPIAKITQVANIGVGRYEFDATTSYDPDGSIVLYRWETGGEILAESSEPIVDVDVGMISFLLTLTVVDNEGAEDNASTQVSTLLPPPSASNTPPVINARIPDVVVSQDTSVSADMSQVFITDPDNDPLSFLWIYTGNNSETADGVDPVINRPTDYRPDIPFSCSDNYIDTFSENSNCEYFPIEGGGNEYFCRFSFDIIVNDGTDTSTASVSFIVDYTACGLGGERAV